MNTNNVLGNKITLGWKVSDTWEPLFWLSSKPKVGTQDASHLVQVQAKYLAGHTAIIAQSGSGKSFFLARLIEEILLHTKARCIIFDPNADFKKFYEVEESNLWKKALYDRDKRIGRLPHEKSKKDFSDKWDKIQKRIKSRDFRIVLNKHQEELKLDWPSASVEFIAEDSDPIIRNELYHCHKFTEAIYMLTTLKRSLPNQRQRKNFIDEAERIYRLAKTLQNRDISQAFNEYDETILSKSKSEILGKDVLKNIRIREFRVRRLKNLAQTAVKYISEEIANFYFGRVQEYFTSGILNSEFHKPKKSPGRLEVIDLPSIKDKKTRLLLINSILSKEWTNSQVEWNNSLEKKKEEDERVPTFIIIDEAHNLIPSEPTNTAEIALREQFRTIIAEGRKYGLFLIIASQRPDKLDPLVLSECENKAIMKLSSENVLDLTKKLLSLDRISEKLLEQTLTLEMGRGILFGKWTSNNAVQFYAGARRTVEGGRNLRDDFWANPLEVEASSNGSLKTSKIVKTIKKKPVKRTRVTQSDK